MSNKSSPTIELANAVSERLYGIVGWLLIALSPVALWWAGVELSNGISVTSVFLSLVFLVFSLVFLTFGVFINPQLRGRLNRRHAVTRFGRIRTVDDRILRPEEDRTERCVACGSRTTEGLIRRYREEYAVAGIPLYTHSNEHNLYCVDCATDENSDTGTPGERIEDQSRTDEESVRKKY